MNSTVIAYTLHTHTAPEKIKQNDLYMPNPFESFPIEKHNNKWIITHSATLDHAKFASNDARAQTIMNYVK